MKAADIIGHISLERGLESINDNKIDLVPLKDLDVHRRDVWSLSITAHPDKYFLEMDKKYKNKTGYYFKFPLANLEEGLRLCRELSQEYGTQPCEMSSKQLNVDKPIYLVVHIHPEFSFTSKTKTSLAVTRELVMNFV